MEYSYGNHVNAYTCLMHIHADTLNENHGVKFVQTQHQKE